MDIFKYPLPTGTSVNLSSGEIINGYDRCTWVEKFADISEFSISGELDSALREKLPIGTLVSRIDTDEVMIVENHEIEIDDQGGTITVSGRGFDSFLEHRILGANKQWASAIPQLNTPYESNFAYSYLQALYMIRHHIYEEAQYTAADALTNVNVALISPFDDTSMTESEDTTFEKGPVYNVVIDLLQLDNLGLSAIRPTGRVTAQGFGNNAEFDPEGISFYVTQGVDLSGSVAFDHSLDEIETANYFWSSKNEKTSCLVFSNYYMEMVHGSQTGVNRKITIIDATDLDEQYDAPPTTQTSKIRASMRQRANIMLKKKSFVEITDPKLSEDQFRFKYREDYRLGDLVGIIGDYNSSSVMRVIEHVEIEDENGYTAYPTLAEP
jgi:hypothetical protein